MSIKRQIQIRYEGFLRSLRAISLPRWLGGRTARLILFGAVLFFSAAYIMKIMSSATGGYQMHELEKQNQALETEVQKLLVEIADNSSMNSINSRISGLNMVEASGIKYLAAKNTSVAKN